MAVTVETAQGRRTLIEGSSATIGRDPGCTIVFADDARVLPQHAVLREVSGRWMIEAKGSELPQIGDGAPARVHWLDPGDVIRLTPGGPELTFQPAGGTIADEASPVPVQDRVGAEPVRRTLPPALWAGAAVVMLGAVFVVVFIVANRPKQVGNGAGQARPEDSEPATPPPSDVAAREPNEGDESAKPTIPKTDIHRALYSVVLSMPDQEQVFQLGTACAVSDHHLLTSAALAVALESLKDKLPALAVSSPVLEQQFDIVRWKVHPRYQSAVADADRAQERAQMAAEQSQQAAEPDEKKQLAGEIADAERAYAEALGRQAAYDVAVLEVRGKLPATVPVAADEEAQLSIGRRIRLAGLAFGNEQHLVDPESPTMPRQVDAQVFALPAVGDADEGARRVVIKISDDLADQNWSGSPLFDSSGKVVAVYSRPALSASNTASAAGAHVATSVDRLPEFAQELVPRASSQ